MTIEHKYDPVIAELGASISRLQIARKRISDTMVTHTISTSIVSLQAAQDVMVLARFHDQERADDLKVLGFAK